MAGGIAGTYVASSAQVASGIFTSAGTTLFIQPFYVDNTVQGTWNYVMDANAFGNLNFVCASATQNDEVNWKIAFNAGTYTFRMAFRSLSGGGKAHILVDGVDIGSIDTYSASSTYNNLGAITGATITTGVKTLSIKISDKHASSSGYGLQFATLMIERTA